jgi:hypothetical protein
MSELARCFGNRTEKEKKRCEGGASESEAVTLSAGHVQVQMRPSEITIVKRPRQTP